MLHTVKTVKKFNDQHKLCSKIKIVIWVIIQDKMMKCQINAISKLDEMQSDIYNIIHSSKYSTAKFRDIFIFISEETLISCLDVCRFISASHKKTITYCHILLYEIEIVQDSSETDKSIWISKMIQSFLYSNSNHDCSTLHQILMITSINDTADELIFKITNMTQANSATKDKIIIHLHSLFSEQDIIYKTAKAPHKSPSSDDFNKEKLEMLAQFDIFRSIYEIYKNVKQSDFIVRDKRVQLIKHSLTTWILQIADLQEHPVSESKKWSKFQKYYNQYSDDELDFTQQTEFWAIIFKLHTHVLQSVSVVMCTINNADISKLYTEFTSEVVFINEAAKITESDAVIALTHYTSASLVMIDNHKQLKLTVLSQCDSSQQFVTQMTMLLFTRLLWLDHLSIMFTEQHQMSSEISHVESKIFYNS